jgi:hypothetical protein
LEDGCEERAKGGSRKELTIPGSDGSMGDSDEDRLFGESDPELALERTDDVLCFVSLTGGEKGADDSGFTRNGLEGT